MGGSPPARGEPRPLVAKGIEYDVHDTLNPKKSNPLGKLPYLELDGRGYQDSTHIVRTLDEISEHGPRLVPKDPVARKTAIPGRRGLKLDGRWF